MVDIVREKLCVDIVRVAEGGDVVRQNEADVGYRHIRADGKPVGGDGVGFHSARHNFAVGNGEVLDEVGENSVELRAVRRDGCVRNIWVVCPVEAVNIAVT